jgi:hypothetical protein
MYTATLPQYLTASNPPLGVIPTVLEREDATSNPLEGQALCADFNLATIEKFFGRILDRELLFPNGLISVKICSRLV